ARELLEDLLAAVDLACSRFRPDSELVALNARAGSPTTVSPLLGDAIDVALRAARQTDGIVDPTVGPALVALGYDRDFAAVAADGAAVTGIPASGWETVRWDPATRVACVAPGGALDLGATAKAWAADRAAAAITRETGASVLVSLGGDIAMAGPLPAGGWPVHVSDDHRDEPGAGGQTIALHGGGLATSSTSVRTWRRGARAIHHIVDPRTGEPAAAVWRTASVAAASSVDANTASTAAIVMGRAAPGWLAGHGLAARLVGVDGDVTIVGAWPDPA
ncbi:MAG: FAD:protein transferase, partial [Solirubrobacteraceae bacterium]|nr:FAD:protein transferase [Solirubrobacteraceae bacterium]